MPLIALHRFSLNTYFGEAIRPLIAFALVHAPPFSKQQSTFEFFNLVYIDATGTYQVCCRLQLRNSNAAVTFDSEQNLIDFRVGDPPL